MTTVAAINTELGTSGMNAQIILEDDSPTLTMHVFAVGGADAPGRTAWTTLTVSDSAATSAAAVLVALRY